MIFVTVGTHEQGFERLVKEVDLLVKNKVIKEPVFIQKGYTEYIPKNCEYKDMITADEMIYYTEKAKIIITHGGPGSIMLPFRFGKTPIVVPRRKEFNEHVDNHQVKFTQKLEESGKVIAVYDINSLENIIINFDKINNSIDSNYEKETQIFVRRFEKICCELIK